MHDRSVIEASGTYQTTREKGRAMNLARRAIDDISGKGVAVSAHEELLRLSRSVRVAPEQSGVIDVVYTFADGSEVAIGAYTHAPDNMREHPRRSDLTDAGRRVVSYEDHTTEGRDHA